jgi:hypothetical protein
MTAITELERRIEQAKLEILGNREEFRRLEHAIIQAEAYMSGLTEARDILIQANSGVKRAKVLREGSKIEKIYKIVLEAGKPLHIVHILEALGEEPTLKRRTSVSGTLRAYVKKGLFFTNPFPNKFGLIEMMESPISTKQPPPVQGIVREGIGLDFEPFADSSPDQNDPFC